MIKKLKFKFIMTAMSSVLAVFMILLIGINIFFTYNMTKTSDSLLNVLVNEDIGFNKEELKNYKNNNNFNTANPNPVRPMPDMEMKHELDNGLGPVPETRNSMRYFVVTFDSNGNITQTNIDRISSVTQDEADKMAQSVKKTESGKIKWYDNYRYMFSDTEDGYRVVFLNCEMTKYSLQSLRINSVLIAAASYLLILLIVILVSDKVIKPISDSYTKQKQFITDASHELKTPLTIISANNELQELNSGSNEYSQAITDEVEHMTQLVNQLVSLSRYDEENIKVVTSDFNLSDAVLETSSAFESVIKRNGKELKLNIDNGIEFNGDEEMIRKLVSILMDNAVKYCDEKGEISVLLKKERHIELVVSNTYSNVLNVSLDHLFDRFYREDKARTRGNGYGLGLSIAKAIVTSHHGNIKAKSEKDNTISFVVTM